MNRPLMWFTVAGTLVIAGCQDSGSSGDYVPFTQTPPAAGSMDAKGGTASAVQTADVAAVSSASVPTTSTAPVPDPTPADPAGATSTAPTPLPDESPPGTTTPSVSATAPTTDATPATAPLVTSSQTGLTGPADRPAIENSASAEPRPIQLLIPSKRFRKERPSNAFRVSYDDIDLLKVLNMEPVPADAVSHFPEWLSQLDGQTVRIRGYMYPTFEATGLTSFTLARDNGICCFVRQPKIYDIISVSLAPGQVSDYIANRPFDVEGIFRIDPGADQTDLSRLYRIEHAKVLN
ncbi:MAG: hypothetical protein ACKO2P_03490 [Planctomycetota bacterium]